MSPLDTRKVTGRRNLRLETFADLEAEIDRIVAADRRGELRALGNWTPAQVLQHVGKLIAFSLDGFPFRYPLHVRLVCRILRRISYRWLIALAFRPGFLNPPRARALEPDPDVSLDAAAEFLRAQLRRLAAGERMEHRSPAEGPVTHEQWVYAHLRHAELHLSFLTYGPAGGQ